MAANYNSRQARVDVLIGGVDQARNRLEQMRKDWAALRKEVELAKRNMEASVETVDYGRNKAAYESSLKQAKQLQKAITETERNINTVDKYLSDVSGQTLRKLNDASRFFRQMLLSVNPKDAKSLKLVQEYIKEIGDEIQRRKGNIVEFSDVIGNIGNVSDRSLSMAKTRLNELLQTTEKNTQKISEYRSQLEQIEAEQARRVAQRASDVLGQVRLGSFDGTLAQTKEAIQLLEQYKQQLKTSDTSGIQEVNRALELLNERTRQATSSSMSLEEALKEAAKVGLGAFDGTYEDLQKLKKTLAEYQSKLKVSDTDGLKRIQNAFSKIAEAEQKAQKNMVDIKTIIRNLDSVPLEELQKAAAQLQDELSKAVRGTSEYVRASAQLRQVNAQIKSVKHELEEHDSQIVATMKRLTSYVLVYAEFNEVVGRLKQLFSANLQLSDSLADIQKTTGLSAEAVADLSREIDRIDTRTAQEQLHQLAASAGQAGLKGKEDILGFVRAADQLTIALNELGNDGVNTLLKISNLTGDGALLGTEKALLAIGSSINELSAASAATAGPITDIISRIGSIGSVSNLSMADMAALGAVVDELGQETEVAGTALTTFITALQTNTRSIAMATGLDDRELERMLKAGNTMEAMLVVLERLGRMGREDGMKALAPILKEFGSEGERMNRVLATLSQNTETLRNRIDLSREAYQEAVSVTEEANVKQESAIGIVNRLGNELLETFVNSGVVDGIRKMLVALADFIDWVKVSPNFVIALKSALAGLTAAYVANTIAVKANLKEITLLEAFARARKAITALAGTVFTARTYTDLLTNSWKALKKVVSTNWFMLLAGAVTAAGVAVYNYATRVSEAAKAAAEHAAALEQEKMRVEALFEGLRNTNTPLREKRKLISEINERYGQYIGFMISETDSAEKLTAVQERLNATIRERMALQLRSKMEEQAAGLYGGKIQESLAGITSSLEKSKGISDLRSGEARKLIQTLVDKNISKPLQDILVIVRSELQKRYDSDKLYGQAAYFNIVGDLEDYIEAQQDYRKAVTAIYDEFRSETDTATGEVVQANVRMLNTITDQWNELKKVRTDAFDDRQMEQHNEKLAKTAREYLSVAKEQMELIPAEQQKNLQIAVDQYEKALKEIERISRQREPNIWGYGKTIDDASVDQLVAKYKQLFDERTTMRRDADYTTAYAREFKDRAEAMEWYLEKLKEIEKKLADLGYTTTGKFLKGKGSKNRSAVREMNEEVKAAMAALEAYFLRRQQAVRQAYIDERITTEEMNRQIDDTEEEHLLARVELRKKLLGQQSTFDKSLYGMDDKDLDKLAAVLKRLGSQEVDGMKKNLEADLLAVQQMTVDYRQRIEQELLKYNPFESLVNQLEESLDRLRILSTDAEKEVRKAMGMDVSISGESAAKRIRALVTLSESAYDMNEAQLREALGRIDRVWAETMSPQQMELLLKKLRDFYMESRRTTESYANDIKGMIEVQWKTSGLDKEWEKAQRMADEQVRKVQAASGVGLASSENSLFGTSQSDNAELQALKVKLDMALQYYAQFFTRRKELIRQAMAANATKQQAEEAYSLAEIEALNQVAEARQNLADKELQITQQKLSSMKGYADAIVEFSGQMGEAAFAEVDDRREAARQLLQTTMQLTKDLIMQKITELVTRKALGAQQVAQEAAVSAQVTAVHGSQAITDLTVQGAKTSGDISASIASGSAKTVGQLGWWGIPLMAVISAVLSGLMGLALGKLNKAKDEVAAATGVSSKGRVAAGMLTYAKGDYPVLGNDGQVYNASYQKELRTGVYGGGAHFGIFSEKKPEMIVDGDTTRKLILDYPHIYDAILTIARHGQLKSASMPVFAAGNYPAQMSAQGATTVQVAADDTGIRQALMEVTRVVGALTDRLDNGIVAEVNPYGRNGAVNRLREAEKFMSKRGLR